MGGAAAYAGRCRLWPLAAETPVAVVHDPDLALLLGAWLLRCLSGSLGADPGPVALAQDQAWCGQDCR